MNMNLRFKTPTLRSGLCDYIDAYIAMKGRISVTGIANANKRNKKLTFKNNAPFMSCKTKINKTFIENTEDLNIVLSRYMSLWKYYKNKLNYDANEHNDAANYMINKNKTTISKYFEYKTKNRQKKDYNRIES